MGKLMFKSQKSFWFNIAQKETMPKEMEVKFVKAALFARNTTLNKIDQL